MDKVRGGKIVGKILLLLGLFLIVLLSVKIVPLLSVGAKELIPAFIGFVGSIIGGVITLVGVKMTIKHQITKDFGDSLPRKLLYLDDLLHLLRRERKLLLGNFILFPAREELNEKVKPTLEELEAGGLLLKAAEIDLESYNIVRELYDYIRNIIQPMESVWYTEEIVAKKYDTCIEQLEAIRNKLIKQIDMRE